jgi:hypothetical protein
MHTFKAFFKVIFGIFLVLILPSCSKSDTPDNSQDPSNLSVEILSVDNETGKAIIQASAQNAVHFQLYTASTAQPVLENETGFFEYVFPEGQHTIEVRAYGASGRYLKVNRQLTISPSGTGPVPLDQGYITPLQYDGYTLVWNDEFSGTGINSDNWVFEVGDGCPNLCGWGNNELEYYRPQNAWVGEEVLTIEARKENFGGRNYTSARLKTQGKKSFQYGRIDIRALLPKGQGIWPALWMLGNDITSVGWPKCGEIDIMEMIGGQGRERQVHGTLHWDNGGGHASYGQSYTKPTGTFAGAYHVFTLIWTESSMKWYVDDQIFNTVDITEPSMSEFRQPFFFILNVAVGGSWPGSPDATTVFPQQMKVDYIRVFRKD